MCIYYETVEIVSANDAPPLFYYKRLLGKRCRILPAGGLGVSPSFIKIPQDWGIRGLIKTISALS